MEEVRAHIKKTGRVVNGYSRSNKNGEKSSEIKKQPTFLKGGIHELSTQDPTNIQPVIFPQTHYFSPPTLTEIEDRQQLRRINILRNDLLGVKGVDRKADSRSYTVPFVRQNILDPNTGLGEVRVVAKNSRIEKIKPIGPNSFFDHPAFVNYMDFRQANLTSSIFDVNVIRNINFGGAILDGSVFKSNFQSSTRRSFIYEGNKIMDTSFDGTSVQNAKFESFNFHRTTFRGANLTGTTFSDLSRCVKEIDFTDSNVTPKQIYSILGEEKKIRVTNLKQEGIIYRKYSFEEACQKLQLSDGQFEYLVLSKIVEVRDDCFNLVEAGFDPNVHHVPQWVVQQWVPVD